MSHGRTELPSYTFCRLNNGSKILVKFFSLVEICIGGSTIFLGSIFRSLFDDFFDGIADRICWTVSLPHNNYKTPATDIETSLAEIIAVCLASDKTYVGCLYRQISCVVWPRNLNVESM